MSRSFSMHWLHDDKKCALCISTVLLLLNCYGLVFCVFFPFIFLLFFIYSNCSGSNSFTIFIRSFCQHFAFGGCVPILAICARMEFILSVQFHRFWCLYVGIVRFVLRHSMNEQWEKRLWMTDSFLIIQMIICRFFSVLFPCPQNVYIYVWICLNNDIFVGVAIFFLLLFTFFTVKSMPSLQLLPFTMRPFFLLCFDVFFT